MLRVGGGRRAEVFEHLVFGRGLRDDVGLLRFLATLRTGFALHPTVGFESLRVGGSFATRFGGVPFGVLRELCTHDGIEVYSKTIGKKHPVNQNVREFFRLTAALFRHVRVRAAPLETFQKLGRFDRNRERQVLRVVKSRPVAVVAELKDRTHGVGGNGILGHGKGCGSFEEGNGRRSGVKIGTDVVGQVYNDGHSGDEGAPLGGLRRRGRASALTAALSTSFSAGTYGI